MMMKPKFTWQSVFILLMSWSLIAVRSLQLENGESVSNYCQTQQMPSNGKVSCIDVHISGLNNQLLCTYTCNSGYKFKGLTDTSISRLCSNGVFSDGSDPPQCISVCMEPELPPFVTLTCLPGTDKLSCRPGCQPSHKLETEPEENYVCETGASWFPDLSSIPKCVLSQDAVLNSELSVCTAWGQDHYRTFDNSIYMFKGHCKYVLAYMPNTFSIMVDNDQTCTNSLSCKRNIIIFIGDNALTLKSTNNGTVVLWNNEIFPVPGSRAGTVIEKVGSYITVRSSLKFSLKWDGSQSVFIKASDELMGQVSGLCGRFNGDPTDDFENEQGNVVTSVLSFASSWKKTELDAETCAEEIQTTGCPVNTPQKSTVELFADSRCGALLTDHIFKQCHTIVDPGPYIQACKADCCEHNFNECMCETMEAYSRACLDQNMELTWRRSSRCEIHCVGGMVYKECGSSCVPDCLNLDAVCSDPTCVDGCFCPDGWVLHNEQCIESKQCPCTHGNKEYQQGSLINEECNYCSCMSGKWNCTQKECDAMCSVMGDPHYSTFDGRRYDFMGTCSYYLVQTPDFNIVIDNIRCGTGDATCTKSLSIDFKGLIVKLDHNHELAVNGKEVVKLPYQTGAVQISMISSLFMQVVLSNGVSVMWDGRTRAYIKVPPFLKGQTLGLCGTYDGKQNNDFFTPQGSIETNSNLFGNQWKTTKDCEDMPLVIATPPCETQSQRKVQAAQLCGQLKSTLFEACHDLEDVTQYYTDCMYDLCSCTENIQDCLCPSLGTYADVCASKGVQINWRLQVKECMLQCPGGQEYQVCIKPCEHTCYALAHNTDNLCDFKCVEGCSCPKGQSLNEEEECVLAEKCPCIFDGHEYPAGFTTLKGTDLCVCTDAQWQCSRLAPDNLNVTRAAQPLCPDNMEYSVCASDCHVTCENMESALTCAKGTVCRPGCVCKDGYVLDGNKCIVSSMCPCYHGGQAYFEGDKFFIDCNECMCKNQRWHCEKNDCPSTCSAYGDSHYTTFDGRKFEFQGSCDYIMAKSTADNPNKFLITTTNLECGTTGVTCSKGIEFISGVEGTSSFYRLHFIRGKNVRPDPGSPFNVREVGEMVYVTTLFGVTIQWDKGTRVYIRLSIQHINKVEGLCGNFNGDQNDDFQTRSGGLSVAKATSFGDSWRVHSTCETSKEIVNTCLLAPQRKSWAQHRCSILASDLFQPCHALVEPKNYIERCEFDACGCDMGGDCECLCTAIAAYAHECANEGMPIKWRSKDLCGLTCADCKEYNPCISPCPKKTCDNRHNYSRILESCEDDDICFEGCDLHPCPDGQVYGSIVEPITCVPEHFCITQACNIDGKKYWEGERIYNPHVCRPECEICNCRNGEVEHITLGACFTSATKYPPLTAVFTKSTNPAITCTQSGWTGWMSASVPTYANVGDRESVVGLRKKYTFCDSSQITAIRCRVIGQPEYSQYFGQILTCSLESGLICYHKDQVEGLCLDYEISYNCDCSKEASTTVRTTSASTPLTTSVSITTRPPVKMCNWTQWMNSYRPTSLGDIESMSNLRFEYSFCVYPSSIICRTVPDDLNPNGIRYDQARQMAVTCDLNRGLVCLNSAQSSKTSCYDYEVAVKCEDGCVFNETTQKTPPVTGVRSTTSSFNSTSSSLSTQSPSTFGLTSTTSASTYQSVSTFLQTNYMVQSSTFSTAESSTGTKIQKSTTLDYSTLTSSKSSPLTSEPSTVNYRVSSVSDHTFSASTLHLSSENWTEKTPHDTATSSLPSATSGPASETSTSEKLTDYTPCPQLTMEEDKACERVGVFDKYTIDNNQLKASSSADVAFDAQNGRLMNTASGPTNGGAWMPRASDPNPHLVIDLEEVHAVAGVATQGRPDFLEWVKSYIVYFSYDGVNFIPYNACGTDKPKFFLANNDSNTIAKVFFDRKIFARKVAIYPIEYVNAIALRVDIITCDVVTTSLETHTSTPATSTSHTSTFSSVHGNTKSTGLSHSTFKHITAVNTEDYSSTSWSTTLTPSTNDFSTSYQQTSSSSPSVSTNNSSFPETTTGFMSSAKCTKSHWLPLINRNTDVVTNGDREGLSAEELTELCDGGSVTKIKCYDTDGIPASQTGEIVMCDLENGLTCSNSENQHICKDYSITYWCKCKHVTFTQTVPTDSTFKTEASVPPTMSTTELHNDITSTTPTMISTTSSSTSEHETASSVHATSSTTKTEQTGSLYNCISGWSSWINRNVPTLEHGEHEMMNELEKREFCPRGRVIAIDCESDGGVKAENDHHSMCTVQDGLICTNLEPIPGLDLPICLDYKVKYYCECEEEITTQQQQSASMTTQKMTVKCGWSPWLSADKTSTSTSDSGDLETIEALKSKFRICPNMKDIECRVAGTSTSAFDAGQAGVKCDIHNGLRCYNIDIVNGVCYDYEVRVLCWDDATCTAATTPAPVETTTPVYSMAASSTVVCPPGEEWNPCAYKCGEVCHFMGHVTGACSEKSLEMCVPGCKSLLSVASMCSEGQRRLDLYTCVDTVACPCLKPDGTIARPFESWANPNDECSKCSCFNNEAICNSVYECTSVETPPTVTQSSQCAWSSWINNDNPDTGSGDIELLSALYSKYGLCAAPVAVECRDANTLQDVHLSGQQVSCTKTEGLQCLNANNGGRCKDYEIRIFCPCQSNTTVPENTSLSSDQPSLFPTSSSVGTPSTSLPVHTNSKMSTLTMQSTTSNAHTSKTFSTLSSSVSTPIQTSSGSSHSPHASSYQTSSITSTAHQSDSSKSSKSSDSSTTQSIIASTLSSRQSYTSSTEVSPPERSSVSTNSSAFTSSSHPSTQTNEFTENTFTTHSIETVKMCGWTDWMNGHFLDVFGDMETVSHLRKTRVFCESSAIISMRCRDIKTKKTPEELGQSQVLCDLNHGLVCINSVQPFVQCADYEVSFLCDPLGSDCIIITTAMTRETQITNAHLTTNGLPSTAFKSPSPDIQTQITVTHVTQSPATRMATNVTYPTSQITRSSSTESETRETTEPFGHSVTSAPTSQISTTIETLASSSDSTSSTAWTKSPLSTVGSLKTTTNNMSITDVTTQTIRRATTQTTGRGTITQTTARDTPQITVRGTSQTTARDTSQTTARDTSQTTAKDTSQTTARDTSQTTARSTSQTTARDTSQTTARDTSQTTARDTTQTTAKDTSQTTARSTSQTPVRETAQTTKRDKSQTTERGTSQTTARGTDKTTARDTSQTTARGTSHTTARDTSQTIARGTSQTTARDTSHTTARDTSQTTARDTSQTTARDTSQTTARDTSQTPIKETAETTARDTSQTTARGTDKTTERDTSQTTARDASQTTARDTSQTPERETVQTTGNDQTPPTKSSIPHASSTLFQSIATRIYQSTKSDTHESTQSTSLHTTGEFGHITTDRISQPYQDSSSHSSVQSTSTQTTPETTSGTSFTQPTIPKVCVNPLTNEQSIYVLDSNRNASSYLSQYSGPERSRIDSKSDNLYTGAWIPQYNSNKQWISITFSSPVVITGITTQGRQGAPEWVKTYTAFYSLDGVQFYNLMEAGGQSSVFTGNVDSDTKHTERVKPTEILVVKIQPETWEKRIALRFELVGCLSFSTVTHSQTFTPPPHQNMCVSELCEQNMGLEDNRIRDDMLSASSFRDAAHLPGHARLGGNRSWMPSSSDTSPYIQVNLMTPQLISGVTTQGRADAPLFVQTFKVNYSNDGFIWFPYREIRGVDKIFYANWDSATPVRQLFQRLVHTQYLRIIPQSWHDGIALRFEIHGCLNTSFSYPTTSFTTVITTITAATTRYHESTNVYKAAVTAGIKDCTEWDQWLDLNHPNLTNRDEIEPIDDLIANSLHCKDPMAIECRPEPFIRQQTNSAIVSCNLWEGFKCLVGDGNGPICNNYKVRLGCIKETPECMSYITNRSPAPVCYPGLDTSYCPKTCQQGFYCNGTQCVPKSACPCILNGYIVPPDGIQRNENCGICQCLNGDIMCAPVSQCPTCTEGTFYRNASSCECQCLTCKPHEFQCGDGSCIAAEKRCNCIIECIDDELECDSTTGYTPSVISQQTTEWVTNITIMSTTTSIPESLSTRKDIPLQMQNCSFSHTAKIENGLTVQLSEPQEVVYEVGDRWSDGLCTTCLCANGTDKTSSIICTEQECSPCKLGEERMQRAGSCCGKCEKKGCVFGGHIYKAGQVLPLSKKCYTTTCEKNLFDENFIIKETQVPCENVDKLPYCQPEINETERYDVTGCCLKCLPPQNSSELTCPTCSTQLVTGNPNDTIGHFKVTLDTGVLCENKEPVPDLKKCGGYCTSNSLYTDVLKGFQSSCSCCQPLSTVPLSVQLHCSNEQDITKDYIVPKECACMPCTGGT